MTQFERGLTGRSELCAKNQIAALWGQLANPSDRYDRRELRVGRN